MTQDQLVDIIRRLLKDRDDHLRFFPSDKSYYNQQTLAIQAVSEYLDLKRRGGS